MVKGILVDAVLPTHVPSACLWITFRQIANQWLLASTEGVFGYGSLLGYAQGSPDIPWTELVDE